MEGREELTVTGAALALGGNELAHSDLGDDALEFYAISIPHASRPTEYTCLKIIFKNFSESNFLLAFDHLTIIIINIIIITNIIHSSKMLLSFRNFRE